MIKVSVIIPFFQKERGILKKTILSAFKQTGPFQIDLIVVDDGSPISAEDEIGSIDSGNENTKLIIINQANAGPGAARNAGIDRVDNNTDYIAFLDSDDIWLEGHLGNAVFALQLGYDFYFSDFYFADYKEQSVFNRAMKIRKEDHKCIDATRQIYAYSGSMMDQILIKGNVIGTPTVVYSYKKYPNLRFKEQFYNGQDYIFWMDFAQTQGNIAVSFQQECDCGMGLNIYAGAGWGTERSLERLKNELFLWQSVANMYQLTPYQKKANDDKLEKIIESIVRDLLHRVVNKKNIKKEVMIFFLTNALILKPNTILLIFKILSKKIAEKFN